MAEKSEKATPKKLRDARKKGQVAKSQDFPAAFTFIFSIATTLIFATKIYQTLTSYMAGLFLSVNKNINLENTAGNYIFEAIRVIFLTSVPIMGITALVGVFVNFIIIGPLFSVQAMKPDIKRLNPVDNLKNIFKLKTFVELLKSIFKITGAVIIIYSVMSSSLSEIIASVNTNALGAALIFSDFLFKVIVRVGLFLLLLLSLILYFKKEILLSK